MAVEGTRGADVAAWADHLRRRCGRPSRPAAASVWNASRIFKRLWPDRYAGPSPRPRTLVLLYAADLAFRLRAEIGPALAAGRIVLAAPYVQTAMGFGMAVGLPREWLDELFRFAPAPDASYRIKERQKSAAWPPGAEGGFLELCDGLLARDAAPWRPLAVRRAVIEHLRALERQKRCSRLTKRVGLGRRPTSGTGA